MYYSCLFSSVRNRLHSFTTKIQFFYNINNTTQELQGKALEEHVENMCREYTFPRRAISSYEIPRYTTAPQAKLVVLISPLVINRDNQ